MFNAVYLMAGAAASYQFHTSRTYYTLPNGLVVINRLYTLQRNLGHLDIEDAVLLYKASTGNSKLGTCTDNPTNYTYYQA